MQPANEDQEFLSCIDNLQELVKRHISALESNCLSVTANLDEIPRLPILPKDGLRTVKTLAHIQSSILPKLAEGHSGPRYYGTTRTLQI